MRIVPVTSEHVADICTWRYPPPYDCYDIQVANSEDLLRSASPFFSVLEGDRLIGFRTFGTAGQVEGWSYDGSALDTGGALRPELVGRGLGKRVVSAGLDFGRAVFEPASFRTTVLSFNVRALRTLERLGFRRVGSFDGRADGRRREVLVRSETTPHVKYT